MGFVRSFTQDEEKRLKKAKATGESAGDKVHKAIKSVPGRLKRELKDTFKFFTPATGSRGSKSRQEQIAKRRGKKLVKKDG
jgi:hypothetical protein